MRDPAGQALSWTVSADVEALAWSPHAPTTFLVSCEDGLVAAFDARAGAGSPPLFRLSAHDAPACALSFNPAVPGLLATASTDGKVLVAPCLPYSFHAASRRMMEAFCCVLRAPPCDKCMHSFAVCFRRRYSSETQELKNIKHNMHAAQERHASHEVLEPRLALDHGCVHAAAQVKLWDLGANKPSLVAAQDLKVGAAFAAAFCPDAPWLLAAGGAAGTVAVWDLFTNAAAANRYGKQLAQSRPAS